MNTGAAPDPTKDQDQDQPEKRFNKLRAHKFPNTLHSTMRKPELAEVNGKAAPAPIGSVDETLKTKTPKKPKGWKKWKRRLSRVFKGKKKPKEDLGSDKAGAKSIQKPERASGNSQRLGKDNGYGGEDDDERTDESPMSSEKENGLQRRQSRDVDSWGGRRRSVESSYQSESEEGDREQREEDDDDGEEYDNDGYAHGDGDSDTQHGERYGDDGVVKHEAEHEGAEEEEFGSEEEPQTDDHEEQELDEETQEAEEEGDEEDDILEGSAVSVPMSTGICELEEAGKEERKAEEEQGDAEYEEEDHGDEPDVQDCDSSDHVKLIDPLDEEDRESDHGEEESHQEGVDDELSEEADDGEYEEDDGPCDEADHEEAPEAPSTAIVGVDYHEDEEHDHQDQKELEELEERAETDEGEDTDDEDCEDQRVQTEDTSPESAVDANADDGLANFAERHVLSDEDRSLDNTVADPILAATVPVVPVVETEALHPVDVPDAVVAVPRPALSAHQQVQLTAIITSIPSNLTLVRDMSAWCLLKSSASTPSSECQLFMLSVERGKWKLAELLAEKLHRDHVREVGSRLNDDDLTSVLSQCAA